MNETSRRTLSRLLAAAVLIVGIGCFFAFGGPEWLSLDTLSRNRATLLSFAATHSTLMIGAFIGVYALAVAFSVPGAVFLTISGGFLFGPWLGTIAAVIGATAGAAAVFLIARYVAGDALRRRAEGAMYRMERGFRRNAVSYLLFLRLVPVFPFWLVNLVPAFFGVPFRIYLVTTIAGVIPGAFVYALVGDGLGAVLDAGGEPDLSIIFQPQVLAPILGLAVLALLPALWRRPDDGDTREDGSPR